ncbi:TPM domain-containing protein [Tsuneonella sp. HG222]
MSDAVAAAEAHTAGEIVTVVADRSDGYSDVAFGWSALAAFTALAVFAVFPQFVLSKVDWFVGGWTHEWSDRELLGIATALAITKFLAVWLVQLWQPLKFALVPASIKTARALSRAIDLFKVGAERRTHGRTGILIYLSMKEHRAEIVADEAITSKVPAEIWGEAMAAMLVHIKDGRVSDGMIAAVEKVGTVLAEHFPRHEDDVNELPDRLIEL